MTTILIQPYHIRLYLVNSVDFDSRFDFAFPGNPFLLTMCVLLNCHEKGILLVLVSQMNDFRYIIAFLPISDHYKTFM